MDISEGSLCDVVEIVNERGLHARAAAKFVRVAESFDAEVSVIKDEMSVSGLSIMGLMMLAAAKGSLLKICVAGPQALAAMDALVDLIKRRFDEDRQHD